MNKILSLLAVIMVAALIFTACKKNKEVQLSVYPNPATDYIIFDATNSVSKHKNGEITIKNTVGEVIKVFKTADSSRIQWQVDTFDRGMYYYWYSADKMTSQTGKIQFN